MMGVPAPVPLSPSTRPVHASQHAPLAHPDTAGLSDARLVFIFSRQTMYGFNKKAVKRYCIGNYRCM